MRGRPGGSAGLWGVVRAPAPPASSDDLRALGVALAGLVTVGDAPPGIPTLSLPAPSEPTDARCLAAAIRALPASAAGVAWFDDIAVDGHTAIQLWDGIGTADAAVLAMPVTDAVKQVHDGRIHGGVARDGLCVPTPPVVVRIDAARSRLLPGLDAGHDPIAALAVAGLVVRVVLRETPASRWRSRAGSR